MKLFFKKNGKVFAIEKNGKFLDLEGKTLQNQNQFIQKVAEFTI